MNRFIRRLALPLCFALVAGVACGDDDKSLTATPDAGDRIFEDEAILGLLPEPGGRHQKAVVRRLALGDVLAGDHQRRQGQAGGAQAALGQFARRRGHHRPAVQGYAPVPGR